MKIVASGEFNPEKIPRFEKLCVPADISTVSLYLFNNNGATMIDYTADVVRVKVHGHWMGMTTVGAHRVRIRIRRKFGSRR